MEWRGAIATREREKLSAYRSTSCTSGTAYHLDMPSTLVIVRHGESTWNKENLFTGWHDVPLSPKGEDEAAVAGRTMAAEGLWFDVGHTSLLTRAVQTANLALAALGQPWLPVQRTWRLNERHYGALQGLDKKATTERHGEAQTKLWRRSYDVPPPSVGVDDPEHPSTDARYRLLPPDVLPATECLKDVVARVLPYWHDVVVPQLRAGLTVVIVAHGNSLRALVKHLEGIADEDIAELNIPTGAPRRYMFDDALRVSSATYLGDADAVAAAAAAVARQASAR
jgi:2,3-bisphosphoglycerate-dependent phosphoglycerate mutase